MATFFIGDIDAPAIIMDHCREYGQKIRMTPLKEDPTENPEYEYVEWKPLNRNYIGRIRPGDHVFFQDHLNVFWELRVYPKDSPVDKTGLKVIDKLRG